LKFPDYGVRTVSAIRPYLFVLRRDMAEATCIFEDMTLLSQDLKDALKNLQVLDQNINYNSFANDRWNLKAPYLQFYHFRGLIRENIPRLINIEEQQHVEVLLRYMNEVFGDDYAEADNLFAEPLIGWSSNTIKKNSSKR
jgi:hypothetical protein